MRPHLATLIYFLITAFSTTLANADFVTFLTDERRLTSQSTVQNLSDGSDRQIDSTVVTPSVAFEDFNHSNVTSVDYQSRQVSTIASQTSVFRTDELLASGSTSYTVTGQLNANYRAKSFSSSIFRTTFEVTDPARFRLDYSFEGTDITGGTQPLLIINLLQGSDSGSPSIFDDSLAPRGHGASDAYVRSWQSDLETGAYTLIVAGMHIENDSNADIGNLSGGTTSFSVQGQFSAIPEPSSFFALGLGLTGILLRRSRVEACSCSA